MATIAEQRQAVILEARRWIGTPYRHSARVVGRRGGTDCIQLLAAAYEGAGIVERVKIEPYAQEWHLHRGAERYLLGLMRYCREVSTPLPGDIALWRFGRTFSHGAIVVEWPIIIHAWISECCTMEDVSKTPRLQFIGEKCPENGQKRPVRFFSPLKWGD